MYFAVNIKGMRQTPMRCTLSHSFLAHLCTEEASLEDGGYLGKVEYLNGSSGC